MSPVYLSVIILLVGAILFYAKFVRREELRHLADERDSEARHAADWKEMATVLADGALTFRGLDTRAEAKLHDQILGDPPDREPTLEELEDELQKASDPLRVSFEGEVGERRELALKIHRMKARRDDGLIEKQEELIGDHVNSLDDNDVAHLSTH